MRIIGFIIAALALGWSDVSRALNPTQELSEYQHLIWRSGDQGLVGHLSSVVQSVDGYLWVGTTAGVFRFDGVRFTELKQADGSSIDLPYLFLATDGSLWISSFSGKGVFRVKDRKVETIDRGARGGEVTEDETGTIWYLKRSPQGGTGELCSWVRGVGTRCLASPYRLGGLGVICSFAHAIWIGSDNALVRFQDGKFTNFPIPGLEPYTNQSGISAILPDGQGGLLVGMPSAPGSGLERVNGDRLAPIKSFRGLDTTLLDVLSLFTDREGAVWIGTARNGIYRIYKDRVDHYAGISDSIREVIQFFEDQEGSIWAASLDGLERFSDRRVITVASEAGFHSAEVDGVSVTRDGTLWVAGIDTLLTLAPGSQSTFGVPAIIPHNALTTSIFEDHTGVMWVGINNTLNRLQGRRFVPLNLDTGAPVGMIVSIAEDRAFNLWAVSLGPPRQILKIDPDRLHVTPAPNLPPASRVAADPAGGIYVAALNGDLVHVDPLGRQVIYPHPAGRSGRIPQISVTGDGTVYALTGFGLEVLRKGRIAVLDTRNGLPCRILYDSIFDRHDNLWLYTQCGAVRIASLDLARWLRDPTLVIPMQLLDAEDGANPYDPPFGGSARTPDGVLWFVNTPNIQKIDPDLIAHRGNPPPVQIEQFIADGKSYDTGGPIKLPPLAGDIQIDYAGLSFVAPDKVRFRYKLDGFDQGWTDAGPRRQAFYTRLPPGNYQFHVIASNNNGVWNNVGAGLSFELAAAFYQTIWLKLLCGMVILAVLWLLLQLRVRQVAGKVRLRQAIQYTERLRIARQLHDSLLQSVQGLMLRFSSAVQVLPLELPTRSVLDGLLDRSDEVIAEARQSIQDLREREERSLDLVQEITGLGQELTGNVALPVKVLTSGEPYQLNNDTHENILLIVREAILNAIKHAGARSLEVQIDHLRSELKISVRDDGQGIEEQVVNRGRDGHWGLIGMRECAAAIHGRLRILSKRGAGTEVVLVVPKIYASAN